MPKHKIAWLPGDGIGVDVLEAAKIVLDKVGLDAEYIPGDIGWDFWCREGDALLPRTIELLKKVDAALFGAITSKPAKTAAAELAPALQDKALSYRSPIVRLRQLFDLYVCLRPCKAYPGNALHFKEGIDLVVYRENTEDLYAGVEFAPVPQELADSHTTSHGALGAFAFGIGATEMASVWALGSVLNVEAPQTTKVVVEGRFKKFVGPKDLILHLIGKISAQGANFKVLEFHGETIRKMSTSGRLVLCNMAVEAGASAGIVPADEETARYLREEAGVKDPFEPVSPDPDAAYERVIEIKVSKLQPQIACPHTVDNVKPIGQVAGRRINHVVIGSCTNGRLDDLAIAARIMKGHKVAPQTRMLIFPASAKIYRQALGKGYVGAFMQAGAVVMNSGCGPCLGVHEGALGDSEVALSTTNRNFKGRMGNPNSEVYLCSPAVAAASAITGVITDPRKK